MAKWRKRESLQRALGREAGSIAKGVGRELLSIATMGLFRPKRRGSGAFGSSRSRDRKGGN